jgi:hypothetical protein
MTRQEPIRRVGATPSPIGVRVVEGENGVTRIREPVAQHHQKRVVLGRPGAMGQQDSVRPVADELPAHHTGLPWDLDRGHHHILAAL